MLNILFVLLQNPRKAIRKEACWTISNITAGLRYHIQAVIDANLIPTVIMFLGSGEHEVRKEACWAIANATTGGSSQQIYYLVEQGCIRPLCDLLDSVDRRIVVVALEALENILEASKLNPNVVELVRLEAENSLKKLLTFSEEIASKAKNCMSHWVSTDVMEVDGPKSQ